MVSREEVFAAFDHWPDPDVRMIYAELGRCIAHVVYVADGDLYEVVGLKCFGDTSWAGEWNPRPTTLKSLLGNPAVEEECKVALVEHFSPSGAV